MLKADVGATVRARFQPARYRSKAGSRGSSNSSHAKSRSLSEARRTKQSGEILGMFLGGKTLHSPLTGPVTDKKLTAQGYAAKAEYLKAALQFEDWVGAETGPGSG